MYQCIVDREYILSMLAGLGRTTEDASGRVLKAGSSWLYVRCTHIASSPLFGLINIHMYVGTCVDPPPPRLWHTENNIICVGLGGFS